MKASRSQLNRLLEPNEMGVSLEAMSRAAPPFWGASFIWSFAKSSKRAGAWLPA
jgi:hypothetical protein